MTRVAAVHWLWSGYGTDVVGGGWVNDCAVHSGEHLFPPRVGASQTYCARTVWGQALGPRVFRDPKPLVVVGIRLSARSRTGSNET